MSIMDAIREGGWPMFPILGTGLVSVILAMRHATKPDPAQRSLAGLFIVLTLTLGVLGTALGVQQSAAAIRSVAADQRWIFLIGLSESLNCLNASLILSLLAFIGTGVGSFREVKKALP